MNGVIIAAAELLTFCERWDWRFCFIGGWRYNVGPSRVNQSMPKARRSGYCASRSFFRGINGPKVVAGCFPAWDRTANVRGWRPDRGEGLCWTRAGQGGCWASHSKADRQARLDLHLRSVDPLACLVSPLTFTPCHSNLREERKQLISMRSCGAARTISCWYSVALRS